MFDQDPNESVTISRGDFAMMVDNLHALKETVKVCAEVFEVYADAHRAKLHACKQDDDYYREAEAKWHRNRNLANMCREALELGGGND